MDFDATTWVLIGVAAAVVVALVIAAAVVLRRRRRSELRERFGPEYDRAVETDGRRAGERELTDRIERRERVDVRPLSPDEGREFRRRFGAVQTQFVDQPMLSALDAEVLVTEAMRARGYEGAIDDEISLFSVDHPERADDFREAHDLVMSARRGDATTEDCRQAVLRYRRCLDTVTEEAPSRPPRDRSS
jgi:hypothetical protein